MVSTIETRLFEVKSKSERVEYNHLGACTGEGRTREKSRGKRHGFSEFCRMDLDSISQNGTKTKFQKSIQRKKGRSGERNPKTQ